MTRRGTDTDRLLDNASRGDGAARARLLDCHRQRLRHMIALRLDRRLAARIDPSERGSPRVDPVFSVAAGHQPRQPVGGGNADLAHGPAGAV
jgi:hypothetical protein